MSADKVLKWAYTYGHLGVESFDTLEGAFSSAHYNMDYGLESLSHFEVVGEGVVTVDDPRWREWRDKESTKHDNNPSYRFKVRIRSLRDEPTYRGSSRMTKHWGDMEWFVNEAEAQKFAAEWAEKLGADRVKVVKV